MIIMIIIFKDNKVPLSNPGCPGPHCVDQASLKLREVLPQPPKC